MGENASTAPSQSFVSLVNTTPSAGATSMQAALPQYELRRQLPISLGICVDLLSRTSTVDGGWRWRKPMCCHLGIDGRKDGKSTDKAMQNILDHLSTWKLAVHFLAL
jgi:hypothetical protein